MRARPVNANRPEQPPAAAGATTTNDAGQPSSPSSTPAKPPAPPCLQTIHAGEEWHLDHSDDRAGYLGVSHSYCNLRAAADKTNGSSPASQLEERPYKWSQRWLDDPPVGTINFNGGRNPEIYIGNGEWGPLEDGSFR